MKRLLLFAALILLSLSCKKAEAEGGSKDSRGPLDVTVGQSLPNWAEGYLDIHAISTGRGECTFYILPDGTSMCVDVGEMVTSTSSPVSVTQRPNASTRAYFTQAKYMKHFLEATGHNALDYMVMTHFHADHYGTPGGAGFIQSSAGNYCMTGMMALYSTLPYKKVFDRAYSESDPDYNFIAESAVSYSEPSAEHWGNFIKYSTQQKGLQVERFRGGVDNQLKLLYKPSSYSNFKIFNWAVNAEYWNGSKMVDSYAATSIPPENACCAIFLLSYGKFDFYAGGDAGTQTKVAIKVAQNINRTIEAMKADHHMSVDCMSKEQMQIFQPKVIVTQSFARRTDQPMLSTVEGLVSDDAAKQYYTRPHSLYFTNIDDVIYTPNQYLYKGTHVNGHVVIRVVPGGDQFYVYQLDDTNSLYKVKSIEGPISCE